MITGQRIFCTLFLLAVALPLAYLCGILVGKQEARQEAARMAFPPAQAAPAQKDGKEGDDGGLAEKILRPQELAFARILRAAPGEKVPEPAFQPLKPAVPAEKQAASGENAAAQEQAMAPGMSPARAAGGPPEPPAEAAELYDFVFQIAAFSSESRAEAMRLRLEAEGFRTRLERSGRLYLVLLLTRGKLSRIEEVRAVMQQMHLGAPIERSRRPVLRPVGLR